MTATATPTDTEPDRRHPGDGKLNPVNHIVRIVVVRLAAGSKPVSQSGGSGHGHLTDDELEKAAAALKKMPAPPSSGGTSTLQGSLNATASNSQNMFDVLKPTDIVVVGREPASVLTIRSKGKEPTRRLFSGRPMPELAVPN